MDVLRIFSSHWIEKILHVITKIDCAWIGTQSKLSDSWISPKPFDYVLILAWEALMDVEDIHVA